MSKSKPLKQYKRGNVVPYPFPSDWLRELSDGKSLLWSTSYGDLTDTEFLRSLLLHLPINALDSNCNMLIIPRPDSFNDSAKEDWPSLSIGFEQDILIASPNSDDTCPLEDYLSIIKKYLGWETSLISAHHKSSEAAQLPDKKQETDLFQLMSNSRCFMYLDFDGFILLGLDKNSGSWQELFSSLISER